MRTVRQQRLAAVTEGRPLADLIREAQAEIDDRRASLQTLQYSEAFFDKLVASGEKKNACAACSRAFASRAEFDKFEAFVRCRERGGARRRLTNSTGPVPQQGSAGAYAA